jgi:hypothetical protein
VGDTDEAGKAEADTTEEIKKGAGDVKEGASQAATGLQGAYEQAKEAGEGDRQAAKGKGKEALGQGVEMAKNMASAAGHALNSLAAGAKASKPQTGEVAEGTKKAGHGITNLAKSGAHRAQTAATGAGHALATPIRWSYNKTTGALSNATIRQPNERFSPWWGVAAIAAGTAGFALATAASWGATLFVTLPALAAGTATLGGLFLAQKLIRRLWNGAPTVGAGSDQAGMSPIGRQVHNTCVTANTTLEGGEKALLADKAAEEKKLKALHNSITGLRIELAQHKTAVAEIDKGLEVVRARKVAPMAPVVEKEAELLASEDVDVVTAAKVKLVPTGTVQGVESSAAPAVHAAEGANVQGAPAATVHVEASTSGQPLDVKVHETAA